MNTSASHKNFTLAEFNNSESIIYGIGNIGRQDDGLGWAFVDWIEEQKICPKADVMRHYQLHLEDADLISNKKHVLFIDASKEIDLDTFKIEMLVPSMDFSFTSHAISIPSVMATCKICFNRIPKVHLLSIKGYEWELKQGLTKKSTINLNKAIQFFSKKPPHTQEK